MDLNATIPPAALPGARDVQDYACGGATPALAIRPESAEAAADVLRACCAGSRTLLPWGGGVALAQEDAPGRFDVVLDTRGLGAMITWEPDDFTLTSGCGRSIATLRAELAARGQELPLEAAHAGRATLGGVLAANASGPRRLRFGAPRDRILGARFVTGDGVLARTGGRVVKNVAGHAVHRLLVGSRGGLGVLLEASLKLLPLPPARVAMVYGMDRTMLADAARWSAFPRREPAALTVLGRRAALAAGLDGDAPFRVTVGFEDDATRTRDGAAFTHTTWGAPAQRLETPDVPSLWQALADAEEQPGGRLTFTTSANTPEAIACLAGRSVSETLVFHALHGRLHLWPAANEAAELVAELAARGFMLIEARGLATGAAAQPRSIRALRARLRAALDPAGVMTRGEQWAAQR